MMYWTGTEKEEEILADLRDKHYWLHIKVEKQSFDWHIELYPTNIGFVVHFVCDTCGDSVNITDYESW